MTHVYALVSDVDGLKHLRCPDCGKEVVFTRPAAGATSSDGYRVLHGETGELLQGDFSARHVWSGAGVDLAAPVVLA